MLVLHGYTLVLAIKTMSLLGAASRPSLMAFSRLPAISLYLKIFRHRKSKTISLFSGLHWFMTNSVLETTDFPETITCSVVQGTSTLS